MLSIVVAKIIRENEQYKYKIVGTGEKYLVKHKEDEHAGDKVLEYLTPFSKEPVIIESVVLQKNADIAFIDAQKTLYRATIEISEELESGRIKKSKRKVFVSGENLSNAHDNILEYIANDICSLCSSELLNIQKFKVIEVLN